MTDDSSQTHENHHFFDMPPEAFHGKIPFIVTDLISELKRRQCEKVVGIFRLNGADTRTNQLINEMDKGRVTDWSKYDNPDDINTISCTLKRYFRKMAEKEPLATHELYQCFIAIMENIKTDPMAKVNLINLVRLIPKIRRIIMGYLCKFLYEIAQNSEENKMNYSNLAICFAPNILVSNDDENLPQQVQLKNATYANDVFAVLIEDYQTIFEGINFDDENLLCNEEDFNLFNAPPINVVHIQNQIFRCNFRHGHIIPFVPLCRLIDSPKFVRPTRDPPDVTSDQGDNMGYSELLESVRNMAMKKKKKKTA